MHPLAAHIGPRRAPERQRTLIFNEINADFFKNRIGVPFDDLQRFFVQNLKIRDVALNEPGRLKRHRRALGPPRRSATAPNPASHNFVHQKSPSQTANCGPLFGQLWREFAQRHTPNAPQIREYRHRQLS